MKARTAWMIGGAVVVAVLAGAAITWQLLPREESPEDSARSYLNALAAGDVDAIVDSGIEISEETATAFLDASGHVSEISVDSAEDSGDSISVPIAYTLDGERIESELTVTNESGKWVPTLDTAVGMAQLTTTYGTHVSVGETLLSTDAAIALLPAEYEFVATPADLLSGTAKAAVASGGSVEVTVEATLRPEATSRATTQLDEYLDGCTAPATSVPESCGIVVPWAADLASVSSIRYRIDQAPTLTIAETGFRADGGILIATVSGTAHDGSTQSVTYRTQDWSLRGDVSFTAGDIVLSVW